MSKRLTTKYFIKKANYIHNKIYDYSGVRYIDWRTPIAIKCSIHGVFNQIPNNHLEGKGCPKCKGGIRLSKNDFIEKAKIIHSNIYDYKNVIYESSKKRVNITCSKHGEFMQVPYSHLSGSGCPKCYRESRKLNTDFFIKKSISIHGDKYSYDLVDYKLSRIKVKIKCHKHGIFEQYPESHLLGMGCPICINSRNEIIINLFLKQNKIEFVRQKTFEDCKLNKKLRFDFYIPNYNLCIEYNGQQHFKSIKYFGGKNKLKITKQRDKIKISYCKKKNISLLIIKYNDKTINTLCEFFINKYNTYLQYDGWKL